MSVRLRRTAIVIGGDVSFGAVIAKALGSSNVNVVIPYFGLATPVNEVVAAIEASKGNAIALFADVTNRPHLEVLFNAGSFAFGKVDTVIHCPPPIDSERFAPLHETAAALAMLGELAELVDTNGLVLDLSIWPLMGKRGYSSLQLDAMAGRLERLSNLVRSKDIKLMLVAPPFDI